MNCFYLLILIPRSIVLEGENWKIDWNLSSTNPIISKNKII